MAVVDAGGVGYKFTIPQSTYSKMPPHRSVDTPPQVQLFSYMSVREDAVELFGFATEEELDYFKLLITVSGVGPRAAISILSLLTPQKLAYAIATDDKKTISGANGIGPKTAARIILELKDKLLKETDIGDVAQASVDTSSVTMTVSGKLSEAQDALMVLGYTRNEALNVLKKIDTQSMGLEEIIKKALKLLMK
jgi:Holliday junction DNA helicase RuvA